MARQRSGDGGAELVPRRVLLQALVTGGVLLDSACGQSSLEVPIQAKFHAVYHPDVAESPIQEENRLAGSSSFALTQPARAGEVEAYACPTSLVAGDTVDVCVSTSRAQGVRLEVYRIGYYQGLGARRVSSVDSVRVSPQAVPVPDPATGLLECHWQVAFSVLVEPDWVTGYYLIKLITDDGFETQTPFVVRESVRRAPLLVQASATTWQAYNLWGGLSLYFNQTDQTQFAGARAYQVSFDRPYLLDDPVWREEYAMVRWLEESGYDVAYVTNMDLDLEPELLGGRQLFMSVGHDEYWSLAARNAVQSARDQGLSLAFFSGNTTYRRIRLDPSSIGVERRIVTCYKSRALDPRSNAPDTTADFGAQPYPRPETELLGLRWAGWAHMDGFPFIVTSPEHWIYEGTGVRANDTLGHIIGYEWDCVGGSARAGLEIVGDSPVVHEYGNMSRSNAVVYYPTSTSFVFSGGTVGWALALSVPELVDARLQRVTQNILARARLLPAVSAVGAPSGPSPSGSGGRSTVIAGSGSAGYVDGAALVAQFNAPAGVAAGPAGELYVTDTGNQLVRKIAADGQVSTLVGPGGLTARAHLHTPTGIAVDQGGVVYVCDTNNHRIVALDPGGRSRVFAGRHQGNADAADPRRATFNGPRGLAFDSSGALYVADFRNDSIRRIDSSGVTTVVSRAGGPTGIAVGPDGTLYYVATWDGTIVSVTPDCKRRVLVNTRLSGHGDQIGAGATAQLRPMEGLLYTTQGLVLSDTGNNRVRFIAFDEQNTVTNLLGNGQVGSGVGAGSDSQVVLPRGLAPFNEGYAVADSANHRILWFQAPG